MPEYRAMRERHGFLELCKNPQAAAEVTLQPVERLGVDAAILFADILLVLEPLGVGLEFTKGDGPAHRAPGPERRGRARGCRPVDVDEAVGFVFETVRLARKALGDRVPLIGFAGAPFTLASYLIEGGASREFLPPSASCARSGTAWHALLGTARRHHGGLPERPDRGRRPGRPALRLVGRHALAGRLPRVRPAPHRGASIRAPRARHAGHPLRDRHGHAPSV